MANPLGRAVAGFAAGALAVAIFHQGMYVLLARLGIPLQGVPWDMRPDVAAYGLPRLVNLMFWGGLWGIAFAWLGDRLSGPGWWRGMLFGMLGPMLLGSWIVVSLIKGRPVLNGFLTDWSLLRLRTGFLLNGVAFGLGLGLLHPLLARLLGGGRS